MTHTRTIAKSADSRGIHSEITAFLNTRFRSGTETWANQISAYRFLLKCYGARSNCSTSIFGSQRSKQWFDSELFLGLARIRGMECRAPERYAEAFFARKLTVG